MRAFPLALAALTLAASGAVAQELPWTEVEVRYAAPDGVELAALVLVPRGDGPFPGAVLIQGSGASDRSNLWARTVAETLARAGIATLLPDKRGSGASEGEWLGASFEVLARDALAGVAALRGRPDIRDQGVGLVGLSQGGYVAPLAALLGNVDWIVDVSGAAVPLFAQIRHELANTARKAGLDPEGVQAVLEIQRRAEEFVQTGDWAPYAAALAAAEGTPWAEVAGGFPDSPESPIWSWVRLVGDFDPVSHWEDVDVPILVAYGEEDEADNVPVAQSVRRLEAALADHGDATIRVFAGTGHALWAADATQENLMLDPAFVSVLTCWIHDRSSDGSARL